MSDYVIMPSADYKAACDSIRAKTKKTDLIKSGDMATEIEGISGGASFNIHYGLNPPEDTSMLWVETEKAPSGVLVENGDPLQYRISRSADDIAKSPEERYDGAIGQVGDIVYILGGTNSNGSRVNTIWKYDRANNKMEALSETLPVVLNLMGYGTVGNKIYLLGGRSSAASNKIYVFDTTTEKISELSGVTLPVAIYQVGSAVVGTKIYLFGGYTTTRVNTIYVFDTEKNTVVQADALIPQAMGNIGAVANGTKVYLFGGSTSSDQKTIYIYDTEEDKISTSKAVLPTADTRMRGGAIEEKIYVFGANSSTSVGLVYSYDIPSDYIVTLPVELYRMQDNGQMIAVYGKDILVFGGDRNYANEYSNHVFSVSSRIAAGSAYIKSALDKNVFALVSGDNTVNIGTSGVYIGTEDYAQRAKAYLHNGTEWEEI